MRKWLSFCGAVLVFVLAGLAIRYAQVQTAIASAPVEKTEFSRSGYTAPLSFGHGNLEFRTPVPVWYIYDEPVFEVKGDVLAMRAVRKVCAQSLRVQPIWDIDFIYFDGEWYKLRSGNAVVSADGISASPKHDQVLGILPTRLLLPVRDLGLYGVKVLADKLRKGALSPREYVARLKQTNRSCFDIPLP